MTDHKVNDSPIKDLEYRRKKVEDYGSTLAQIRARVKANRAACPRKEVEDGEEAKDGITEEISERCQSFKKLVQEDRLKVAEIEKDRPKIQATVEALKKDKEVWKQREQRIQESLAKQNAAPLEVPAEVKKKLLDMEDLISDLKEKLAAKEKVISSQVQAVKALNDQLSERTKEFYDKVEQMASNVDKIEAEHASHEDMLKKQIEIYKDKLQEAVLQTNAKEKECKRLVGIEKELNSLREDHSECNTRTDQLKEQIDSLNKLIVKLKVQLKNVRTERDSLRQRQDDQVVDELKNQVALLEEEKGKYEEAQTQMKSMETKIRELEEVNSNLKTQQDTLIESALKERNEQILSLEQNLQLAKEASLTLKEEWESNVEEATKDLKNALEVSEKNRLDLQETIRNLESEKNSLLTDMKIREESYEENFNAWESTKSHFEKERAVLQESFSIKEKELKEMLEKVCQLEKVNESLLEDKDALISSNLQDGIKIQEFIDRVEALEQSKEHLLSENAQLNGKLREEEAKLITATKLVQELEVKLKELKEEKESIIGSKESEGAQLDQFTSKLNALEKANEHLLLEKEQLSDTIKKQSLRIHELEEKCEEQERLRNSLLEEKQSLINDLEMARTELAHSETSIIELREKVRMFEERVNSLAGSVDESIVNPPNNDEECEELMAKLNSTSLYNSTLLAELEELKLLNGKLKEEISQCHAKSWDTDMLLDELKEANECQTVALEEKDKKISQLEKELSAVKVSLPSQQPLPDNDQTIKLKKLAAKCKIQAKQCKEMEQEIQRLTKELTDQTSLLHETSNQKEFYESELKKANNELAALWEKGAGSPQVEKSNEDFFSWGDFPAEDEQPDIASSELITKSEVHQVDQAPQLNHLQEVLDSKEKQIKALLEKINFYEETVNFEELEKLKQMYETEFIKNDSVISNLKLFEKELTHSKESVESLGEQLSKVKCDYEKALQNSQDRESYIETLEQDLVTMKTKMYSIESNIEDRHKEIEEKAKQLEVKLEETLAKNSIFLKYHEEMGQKLGIFQDNENSMKETIASLTTLMEMSESKLSEVQDEKSELEEKNNNLSNILNDLNCQLEKLKQLESEVERLTKTVAMKDEMLGLMEDKELQYITKIEDISNLNQSYGEELNILRQEVQLKSDKLSEAGSEITDLMEQAKSFYNERELLQSQISSLSTKLQSLEECLKSSCQQEVTQVINEAVGQETSEVPTASVLFSSGLQMSSLSGEPQMASSFFGSSDDGWGWVQPDEPPIVEEPPSVKESSVNELLKRIDALEAAKEKALSELEESKKKIGELKELVTKLKKENEKLGEQGNRENHPVPLQAMKSSQGTSTSSNSDELKTVLEEKCALEKQLMVLRAENYQQRMRAEDLERTVAEIKPHYDLINNSLMVAQNESYSLNILLQDKEVALNNLQKINNELKEKVAALELEISEMKPKTNEDELPPEEPPAPAQTEEVNTKQKETDEKVSNLLQSFFCETPSASYPLFGGIPQQEGGAMETNSNSQESIEELKKRLETVSEHLKSSEKTVRTLKEKVDPLQIKNQELKVALEQSQKALLESETMLRNQKEAFSFELENSIHRLTIQEAEIDQLREKKAQLERECHNLRIELEDTQERVKHLQSEVEKTTLLLSDAQEMCNGLQSELDLVKTENSRLKKKETNSYSELEIHQGRADKLQNDLSSLTAKLRSSEEMCSNLKMELETLKHDNSQLQEMSISGHNHLQLENEELKRLVNERDSTIQLLNSQLTQENEERKALEENYLGIQSYCQQLTSTLTEQSNSLAGFQEKIGRLEDQNSLLQTLVSDKQKAMDALQRQVHLKEEESKQNQILLEQKMSEMDSTMLLLSKKELELEQLSTILADTQNKLIEAKEANSSDYEARLQQKLDDALRANHEQDVKIEEYSLELMRLLEERDTLQLRLSNALRKYEELQRRYDEVNQFSNNYDSFANSPMSNSSSLQPYHEKMGELQGTYSKDVTLKADRESRHNDQMSLFSFPQSPDPLKEGSVKTVPPSGNSANISSSFQNEEPPTDASESDDYGVFSWFFKSRTPKEPSSWTGT